jgi:hypothetical protein
MDTARLTPEAACDMLRAAGVSLSSGDIEINARDDRCFVALPGDRIAWFATSDAGLRRLATERRVLRLIADRCSFRVPRVVVEADIFDIRAIVPGRHDPWDLYRRCQAAPALAGELGESIGHLLAEQHTRVGHADVAGWLRERVAWPESVDWMRSRVGNVVDDRDLLDRIDHVLDRYQAVTVTDADRALIHGDVGFHNLAVDPASNRINGIYDYDSAAWADRHHDFRYLLFDAGRDDMLEAALRIYEPRAGRRLDRARIRLYNAACAVCYLAFREGTPPDALSCGRTLADDLRWVRHAMAAVQG